MIFNCVETCYWHLIEKRFCYDESIALYEEPLKPEKQNNAFENMAFYDQVSLIAGRAIVTIEPMSNLQKPIEHQPHRRVRWWEDPNVDEQNKVNEAKNYQFTYSSKITTIMESSKEDLSSSGSEEVDDSINNKRDSITMNASFEEGSSSMPDLNTQNKNTVDRIKNDSQQSKDTLTVKDTPPPRKSSSAIISGQRKIPLRERRMSRSLTLTIDRNLELPVIRQLSMPKFYTDTPEANQLDSSMLMTPSTTLTSPIMPRSTDNGFFDLRSIVQMETESRAHMQKAPPVPVHRQLSQSRLSQIKDKLKSTKIKRQGSTTNLPNSIQHI